MSVWQKRLIYSVLNASRIVNCAVKGPLRPGALTLGETPCYGLPGRPPILVGASEGAAQIR